MATMMWGLDSCVLFVMLSSCTEADRKPVSLLWGTREVIQDLLLYMECVCKNIQKGWKWEYRFKERDLEKERDHLIP